MLLRIAAMELPMALAGRLKSETRKHLLSAAGELLVSVGYLDATVAQICSRAGVSNGSFFHLFKTKAEIAEALIEDIGRSYREEVLSRLLVSTRTPDQAIGAVLNAHVRWITSDSTRARLWFGLRPVVLYLGGDRGGDLHAGDAVDVVREWALPLIATGEIRSMPVEVIAAYIFGGADAVSVLGFIRNGAATLGAELARSTATMAWNAIRVRGAQRSGGLPVPAFDLLKGYDVGPPGLAPSRTSDS